MVFSLFFGFVSYIAVDGWQAFGRRAEGARRARMERSPQWKDGSFANPQPLWNDGWRMLTGVFSASDHGSPDAPLPVLRPEPAALATAPESGLRVTWLGHSTLLIDVDGHRILTDPVWGPRSSPVDWIGPARFYDPLVDLEALPSIDAVVISHDHYDHLDYPTIRAIKDWDTTFIVPLGVGSHLAYWGVPEARIREVDWWDTVDVGALEVVCTPARHASGRTVIDKDATLWASYAFIGREHRVYFSGDTGLFPAMREIGERYGPFDIAMIESGAYNAAWPDWHLGPEQAVLAHQLVQGRVLLPVHWGLFNLAYHAWTEPVERVLAAAADADIDVVVPRPGESIEPTLALPTERWWPKVPWKTADEAPVVATEIEPSLLEGLRPKLPPRR